MFLVGTVTSRPTDDLNDLSERPPIAHRERVLAVGPVEAFLRHAQRDDEIQVLRAAHVSEVLDDLAAFSLVVFDEVSHPEESTIDSATDIDDSGGGVLGLDLTKAVDNRVDLLMLVLG